MQLLKEIGVVLPDRFELFCDSESAAAIAQSPVGSKYTKHIDVRLLFLKELCCDRKLFDVVLAHKEPLGQRTVTSGRWLNGLGVERIDRQLAAAAVSAGLLPGQVGHP